MNATAGALKPLEFNGKACASGVTRLCLTNFRSYPEIFLNCGPSPVVITGPNGIGKTNLLEAISLLAPGKGLRGGKLSEHTNFKNPQEGWSVALQLSSNFGTIDLGTSLIPGVGEDKQSERRQVHIQQAPAKQEDLSQYLSVLWLTPQMDLIFSEGSSTRRRFFDRLVYGFDRSHASRILKYEHLARERLKLLRSPWAAEEKWIASLEEQLAESTIAIAGVRLSMLAQLQEAEHWALGVFPVPGLDLQGDGEDLLRTHGSALKAEEAMLERFKQSRVEDKEAGRTHVGAHKTDFKVVFQEKQCPAELCSTGEQKAMLISIIMAACRLQITREEGAPVLLLDEVVAHLDPQRRTHLFQEILNLGVQAWMTGTDSRLFYEIYDQIQHFEIVEGCIKRL